MPTVLISGATSGIGLETALALARAGNRVVLGARDQAKADRVSRRIRDLVEGADISSLIFDLEDLESVANATSSYQSSGRGLDTLINNAGVMALPARLETRDGFEMQLGVNHIGHFALTVGLSEVLERSAQPRVVTVSSFMHRFGRINFADLNSETGYSPWAAYSQSKLANLLFAFELGRRFGAAGSKVVSVAAHPGYSATNLVASGPMMGSRFSSAFSALQRVVAQSAAGGAAPVVMAATASTASGTYFGPGGPGQFRGRPVIVRAAPRAYDLDVAKRLIAATENMAGLALPH